MNGGRTRFLFKLNGAQWVSTGFMERHYRMLDRFCTLVFDPKSSQLGSMGLNGAQWESTGFRERNYRILDRRIWYKIQWAVALICQVNPERLLG